MKELIALERSSLFFGSAVNMLQWLHEYKHSDYSVKLFLGEDGELKKEAETLGIATVVNELPKTLNNYGKKNLGFARSIMSAFSLIVYNFRFVRTIKKETNSPDVLVCNNYRSYVYFLFLLVWLRLSSNIKLVLRIQTSDMPIKFLSRLIPYIFHKTIIHGTEKYCFENFGSLYHRNNVVGLPNPVDQHHFIKNQTVGKKLRDQLCIPNDAFVFICVAYIEPRKGVLELFNSFSSLALENTFLIHVGDSGRHDDYLEDVKNAAGPNIKMLGRRTDVRDLLSVANAFVLYSKYEGMPLAILEAMSCQLPIITTEAGSNEEVVTNECGDIIPFGDEAGLKSLLEMYSNDSRMALEKGLAGRTRVEKYYGLVSYFSNLKRIY